MVQVKSMQKERTAIPYRFIESCMHSYCPRSYFYATANHHIMYRAKNLSHWIRLDAKFHSDLAWRSSLLDTWNSHSMMEVHAPSWNPTVEFSSVPLVHGSAGQSGITNGSRPPGKKHAWQSVGITAKELTARFRFGVTMQQWSIF